MGVFFLAPAEGCSLRQQQKDPLGSKVILSDERENKQADGRMDNGFKGDRHYYSEG